MGDWKASLEPLSKCRAVKAQIAGSVIVLVSPVKGSEPQGFIRVREDETATLAPSSPQQDPAGESELAFSPTRGGS